MDKISLDEKFALFDERWRPKTIAALNGQEVKLVKVQGEFPWHRHEHEDEFFMVWRGRFRVEISGPCRRTGSRGMRRGAARGRASHLCRPRSFDPVLRARRNDQYRQCDGLVLHRAAGGHLAGCSRYSSWSILRVMPPSITKLAPVTKPERSPSNSQLTSSATSSSLPTRPAGCCL